MPQKATLADIYNQILNRSDSKPTAIKHPGATPIETGEIKHNIGNPPFFLIFTNQRFFLLNRFGWSNVVFPFLRLAHKL